MAQNNKKAIVKQKNNKTPKASVVAQENEIEKNTTTKFYVCTKCGCEYSTQDSHFYKNIQAGFFENNNGYLPFCTNCLQNYFDLNIIKYNDIELATRLCCAVSFVVFDKAIFDKLIKTNNNYSFGDYIKASCLRSDLKSVNPIKKTYSTNVVNDYFKLKELKSEMPKSEDDDYWTAEEEHNKQQVIDIVGYDPFVDYTDKDRKCLFAELLKYLDDDELLSDTYKLSQILQLVNNNNQIKQCDVAISLLNPLEDSDELKNLINLKSNLVGSNDKIAKENRISVKNREGNNGGKGTITGLMREMREKNIDEIAANYYEQLKSPSSRWAAEVSAKALRENCYFDENDINDILYDQRELIQKLQNLNDDLIEQNRLLNIELNKNKNNSDNNIGDE